VPLLSELENRMGTRSDIVAYQKGASSAEKMTLMKKFSFIPKINGFGAYEFNDSQLGGFNATNWTLGLSLRWDVFKGFDDVAGIEEAESDYIKAKTAADAQIHKAKSDLTATYKQYETAKRKHELSRKSLEQSSRYLEIIKNRYAQGLEKTADLLNAETAHLQSKLAYYQSIFEQNIALLQLEFFTESTIIKE
jgi:outer membrane protein TolC